MMIWNSGETLLSSITHAVQHPVLWSWKTHLLIFQFPVSLPAGSQLLETTHASYHKALSLFIDSSEESPHRILVQKYLRNNLHHLKEGMEKSFHIHLW